MNTDQIMLSPAKRARRCALNLLVCLIVGALAYAGLHADHWSFKTPRANEPTSGAARENSSSPLSSKDTQVPASVQLSSVTSSLASAYLVVPVPKR